jgi:very-short-patch-repair endonuclease
MKHRARSLRKNMTDVERLLWGRLRNRQLGGYKFRRQHPIGQFFVDFVCLEKKLVIEVDGGQHAMNLDADVKRSDYLKERGFRVLRFWNNEVLEERESVLSVILSSLFKVDPPHPDPLPPKAGGEGDVGQDWRGEEGI